MSQERPDHPVPAAPVTLMTLFTRPVVLPCAFAMSASPTRALVRNLIQKHGGTLYDPRMSDQADHRIRLSEPGKLVLGQDTDIFNHKFIKACVDAGRILPNLSDFRMNQPSFFEDYDPLDILMGRLKWSDLVRLPNAGLDQGEDGQDDRSLLGELERRRSELQDHRGRQIYTRQDQQAILDYIRLRKRYSQVKGRQLWVQMETDRVCGGHHSWQSMKEHFRKQIMPQITNFPLKHSQIMRFRRAMDGDVVNDDESEEDEQEPEDPVPPDQDLDQEQNQFENQEVAQSQTKDPFTREDEQSMVNYIVKNKKYSQLKRDSLWREMEKAKLCQNPHVWRAMKRYFLGKIMPQIEEYELPSSQIKRLRSAMHRNRVISSEDEETEQIRNQSAQLEGDTRSPDIEQVRPEGNARQFETESLEASKAKRMRTRQTQNLEDQTIVNSINVACDAAGTTKKQDVVFSQRKSQENANNNTRSKSKRLFDNRTPTFDEFESGVILPGTANPRRSSPVKSNVGFNMSASGRSSRISTSRGNVDPQLSVSSHCSTTLYTKEEDQKLIDFVANHGLYDRRNGKSIWVVLERQNLLPGRTWQSMRTRYLKYIEPKFKQSDLRKADPKNVNLDESRAIQNQAGNFFTRNEDQKIIDFIVENRRFGEVGGNALWNLMEARTILPGRTSQSMKERFRKRILPNMHLFDIEPADRLRFRK